MRCGSIGLSAGLSCRMPSPCCRCCQVIGGCLNSTSPARDTGRTSSTQSIERDGSFLCVCTVDMVKRSLYRSSFLCPRLTLP